jgi:hypothetical protein
MTARPPGRFVTCGLIGRRLRILLQDAPHGRDAGMQSGGTDSSLAELFWFGSCLSDG